MNTCNINNKYNPTTDYNSIRKDILLAIRMVTNSPNWILGIKDQSGKTEYYYSDEALQKLINVLDLKFNAYKYDSDTRIALLNVIKQDLSGIINSFGIPINKEGKVVFNNFTSEWKYEPANTHILEKTIETSYSDSETENDSIKAKVIGVSGLGNAKLELWSNEFGEEIMKRTVFGELPKTGSFNEGVGDTTYINDIIFKFRNEILQALCKSFFNKDEEAYSIVDLTDPKEIKLAIDSVLNKWDREAFKNCKTLEQYQLSTKLAYILRYFDELLHESAPYISKNEFYDKNSDMIGKNMYVWIGPTVNHDVSWKNSEFVGIEKYTGSFVKMICEYLPEIDLEGHILPAKISFSGFNNAMATVQEWLWCANLSKEELNIHKEAIEEYNKGINADWGKIIDLFLNSASEKNGILANKLRGIRKYIFGTVNGTDDRFKSIPDQFKTEFKRQIRNTAKSNYLAYRMKMNDTTGMYELTGMPLKEQYYNTQEINIRNRIASRVYYFKHSGISEFKSILEKYGIQVSQINGSYNYEIRFTKYNPKHADKEFIVKVRSTGKKYNFSSNSKTTENIKDLTIGYRNLNIENAILTEAEPKDEWDQAWFKDLILELGLADNLNNCDDIISALNSSHHSDDNLISAFYAPVILTIVASQQTPTLFSGQKINSIGYDNGLYNFYRYTQELRTTAQFNGIANGVEELNVLKDGEGNNLPGFQLSNQMEDIHSIIEDHKNPSGQNLRDSMHSKIKMNTSIFKNNNDLCGENVVQRTFIRGDAKVLNVVKKAAKMNVSEITTIAVLKDFVAAINTGDGKIVHQCGTFADKTKQMAMEINAKNIGVKTDGSDSNLFAQVSIIVKGGGNTDSAIKNITDHIKKKRKGKLRAQLFDLLTRYKMAFPQIRINIWAVDETLSDTDLFDSFLEVRKYLRNNKITENDIRSAFRTAKNGRGENVGADITDNFDFVVWNDGTIDLNPTLFNNMLLYFDLPGKNIPSYFDIRMKSAMAADIRTLIKEGCVWSEVLDPSMKSINIALEDRMKSNPKRYRNADGWFDKTSGELKFCRVFKKNTNGSETEIKIDITNVDDYLSGKPTVNSDEYEVIYNPLYEAYFYFNSVISPQMQDLVLGDIAAYDVKATINKKAPYDYVADVINPNGDKQRAVNFFANVEAEQNNVMSKRAMLLGATRFAIDGKMKVAVVEDIKAPTFNNSGIEKNEVTQDGGGYECPLHVFLDNAKLGSAAVGMNRKSIYGYVDPQTGVLQEIKWASFSITNFARRNFDPFAEMDTETMFKKMTNLRISTEDQRKIDFYKIYSLNPNDDAAFYTPLYRYDNDTNRHYKLLGFKQDNSAWKAEWQRVDAQGNVISYDSEPFTTDVDTTSLYTIDQSIGGAWMEYYDDTTKHLQYDDFLDSKILASIVSKYDLGEYYIAYVINKTAFKVGAKNVNSNSIFTIDNNDELNYFEMLQNYGGVQLNAEHKIDLGEVTEMSQMVSSLIQRGLKNEIVDEIYSEIGQVALDALDVLSNANMNENPNELFKQIGQALMDTFESGGKSTIGLAQAFIRRASQIIKSNSNATIKIPLSAETITPAYLNTVASLIRKRGIKRRFSGFPGVQVPSYGMIKTYSFTDVNGELRTGLNYQELTSLIDRDRRWNLLRKSNPNLTFKQALTDKMLKYDFLQYSTWFYAYPNEIERTDRLSEEQKDTLRNRVLQLKMAWEQSGFGEPVIVNGENVNTWTKFCAWLDYNIYKINADPDKDNSLSVGIDLAEEQRWTDVNGNEVIIPASIKLSSLQELFDGNSKILETSLTISNFKDFLQNGGKEHAVPKNPFIKKLENPGDVDFEQHLIIISRENGNVEELTIRGQKDYDYVRNLLDWNTVDVYDWTIQAKNLKGANTEIIMEVKEVDSLGNSLIKNEKYTIFDMDASRASYYLSEIQDCLKKGKNPAENIQFLDKKIATINAACFNSGIDIPIDWIDKNTGNIKLDKDNIPELIKLCTVTLRNLCNSISRGKRDINVQQSFRLKDSGTYSVFSTRFIPAQIIIGKTNAKVLGLQKGDTIDKIKTKKEKYFENVLKDKFKTTENVLKELRDHDIKNLRVDAIVHLKNGNTLIVSKRDDNHTILDPGIVDTKKYEVDSVNKIWYKGDEFCEKGTKTFKTIDSLGYDIMYVDNLSEIGDLFGENQVNLIDYNLIFDDTKFTEETRIAKDGTLYKVLVPTKELKIDLEAISSYDASFAKYLTEQEEESETEINESIFQKLQRRQRNFRDKKIKSLAKQRWNAFQTQLRFIGARIPTQAMQSYADVEVIAITDSELNGCYMARNITWIAGSDFDIDKFYCMGYELSDDGRIVTQSNLDRYFQPGWVLGLPNPDGKEFDFEEYADETGREEKAQYAFDLTEDLPLFLNGRQPSETEWEYIIERILKSGKHKILVPEGTLPNDTDVVLFLLERKRDYEWTTGKQLLKYLNVHSKTKLGRKRKDAALKNRIVQQIHDVCSDIATQVDSQLPINMDEMKEAAAKNSITNDEMFFNPDQAFMKFKLQYQNSLGKDGIGSVAVSMKAYFIALKSFNAQVKAIAEDIRSDELNSADIVKRINNLIFESKSGNELLVFGNINFQPILDALDEVGINVISINPDIASGLKKELKTDNFYTIINGRPIIKLRDLVLALQKKANGEYFYKDGNTWKFKVVDVAMSLSGLLSAATDNAKELILDKLNATPEFIDIYSSALTEGTDFNDIADLMTSDVFNVISRFTKSNIFSIKGTSNPLKSVIDFILNKGDLNAYERGMWEVFVKKHWKALETQAPGEQTITEEESKCWELLDSAIRQDNQDSIKNSIKTLIHYIKNRMENDPVFAERILKLISESYETANESERAKVEPLNNSYFNEDEPEDNSDDSQEYDEPNEDDDDDVNYRSKFSISRDYINSDNVSSKNWRAFYAYVKDYVIVKNKLLEQIIKKSHRYNGNRTLLDVDLDRILKLADAAEELKMLGSIGKINQGVQHTFVDEYAWVKKIEAFINKRYYNAKTNDGENFEPFDFIKFVDLRNEVYRNKQIEQYEKVKSSINILRSVTETKNFNAMLNFVKLNRNLIERAAVNEMSYIIANKILDWNSSKNKIAKAYTQALSKDMLKTIKGYSRDLLISTWFTTIMQKGTTNGKNNYVLKFTIPAGYKSNNYTINTSNGVSIDFSNPKDCTEANIAIFLEFMDNYVIPRLRRIGIYNGNEFLSNLQLDVRKNSLTDQLETKTVLSMNVNDVQTVDDLRKYDKLVADFKKIAKIPISKYSCKKQSEYHNTPNVSLADTDFEMSIGDALFLYNLFMNKDGFGKNSWTRIFEDLITANMQFPLIDSYYDFLYQMDAKIINWKTADEQGNPKIDENYIKYDLADIRRRIAIFNSDEAWKANINISKGRRPNGTLKVKSAVYKTDKNLEDLLIDSWHNTYYPFNFNNSKLILTEKLASVFDISYVDTCPAKLIIDKVVKQLNDKGIKVKVEFDSNLDENECGMYGSGTIYLNPKLDTKTISKTFIHELGHLLASYMRTSGNLRTYYYAAIDAIINKNAEETPDMDPNPIQKIWQEIASDSAHYNVDGNMNTSIAEEVFVRLLEARLCNGEQFKELFDNAVNSSLNEDKIIESIIEFLQLDTNGDVKPSDFSLKKLSDMSVGDMMFLFNSALFELGNQNLSDLSITGTVGQKVAKARELIKRLYDEKIISDFNC